MLIGFVVMVVSCAPVLVSSEKRVVEKDIEVEKPKEANCRESQKAPSKKTLVVKDPPEVKAPKKGKAKKKSSLKEKSKRGGRRVAWKNKKLLTGKVTFVGLSEDELRDFRIIPEERQELVTPENMKYDLVDGFWWRGEQGKWFKIPDHAEVWVVLDEARKPEGFGAFLKREGFSVLWNTLPGIGWVSELRGGISEPGFYPDQGKSRIWSEWPFRENYREGTE